MTDKPAQSDAPSTQTLPADNCDLCKHAPCICENGPVKLDFEAARVWWQAQPHNATVALLAEYAALRTAQADAELAGAANAIKTLNELIASQAAKVAQLERERDEAASEVAACLQFLGNSLHWEGFRGEMLTPKDDVKQQNCHAENVRLLSNYLKETGHGIKFLAALSEARERASLIPLACQMAALAHADQLDHCGKSAVLHVFHVGFAMSSDTDMIVGLLHDSVEDAGCSLDSIRSIFGDEVADAVNAITHPKHEPYSDYLNRVMQNPIAHRVKIVDATHNLSRTDAIQDETLKRRLKTKFTNALSKLGASGAAGKGEDNG